MSEPSPKAGRLFETADSGRCDHTGVIHRDTASNARRGLDFGEARFNVFVPISMGLLKTLSCSNYVNPL
jgi:hypothetical protein